MLAGTSCPPSPPPPPPSSVTLETSSVDVYDEHVIAAPEKPNFHLEFCQRDVTDGMWNIMEAMSDEDQALFEDLN